MSLDRRESGEDRGDLLSMLLMAQDPEHEVSGMSGEQVRDEAPTLFLVEHEATVNALTRTWYLSSRHPEVEARLHAELESVLGDEPPTVERLSAGPHGFSRGSRSHFGPLHTAAEGPTADDGSPKGVTLRFAIDRNHHHMRSRYAAFALERSA